MKSAMRCLVFVILVAVLFAGLQSVLRRKGKTWEFTAGFWAEPENTLDVVCVGSSHAYCSLNPVVLFRETGLRSYCLGSPSQPVAASYAFLKEAFLRQKPKVVLLETFTLDKADGVSTVPRLAAHNATDQLAFGKTKSELIGAMRLEDAPENYYIDFLQYHSRWKELTSWDYTCACRHQPYHGYQLLRTSVPIRYAYLDQLPPVWDKGISVELAEWLDRINDLVSGHGARLVVFTAPFKTTVTRNRFYRALDRFLANRGIAYFNLLDRRYGVEIDGRTDFYDADDGHLNWRGAERMTVGLSRILLEQGVLAPRDRSDAHWQEALRDYETFCQNQERQGK